MHVRTIPRSHGILKRIMQLAEGIPSWNVECAFDDGVGGTDEGEVECISIPFRRKEEREKKKGVWSTFLKELSFSIDTHTSRNISCGISNPTHINVNIKKISYRSYLQRP